MKQKGSKKAVKQKRKEHVITLVTMGAVVLAVVSLLVVGAIAAQGKNIKSFTMGNPAARIAVGFNTEEENITLPETLTAVLEDGSTAEIPVTWTCASYDKEKAGSYAFTAQFTGYSYAEAHPYAIVTVSDIPADARLERNTPTIDLMATEENLEIAEGYFSSTVRLLAPVDMTDKTFTQAQPGETDNLNDTYYRFGYNAPENVDDLYANDQLAVYTAYSSPKEYPDKVVITYRVFGSIDDSGNYWFCCDENGTITDRVIEVGVAWSNEDFDITKAGESTIIGTLTNVNAEAVSNIKPTLVFELEEISTEIPEFVLEHEEHAGEE